MNRVGRMPLKDRILRFLLLIEAALCCHTHSKSELKRCMYVVVALHYVLLLMHPGTLNLQDELVKTHHNCHVTWHGSLCCQSGAPMSMANPRHPQYSLHFGQRIVILHMCLRHMTLSPVPLVEPLPCFTSSESDHHSETLLVPAAARPGAVPAGTETCG